MVWGCFISDKLSPIVFSDGTVKKEVYVGMLDEYFLLFLDAVYTDDSALRTFQQNNARSHIAKMTHDWFNLWLKITIYTSWNGLLIHLM